jgi:phospholipid/cholesterol/gamma-HCH transport system ATP-binding protein
MMETTVAEVRHLKKSFGQKRVLKDLSFTLAKGENLVVFGKSGSGKSVLIKCLVGLLHPDEGEVTLLGKNMEGMPYRELNALRKKVGFLFQSGALYDSMTILENLEFPMRDDKEMKETEKEAIVKEALKNVGLEDVMNKMPSELSGGMRKRVGLARALILHPEIIFYDEPTTGLDPITSKEISHLIVDVQKKYNTAAIIITHDVECARITSNRMLVIKEGEVVAEGTFDELTVSADEWVRSFFK